MRHSLLWLPWLWRKDERLGLRRDRVHRSVRPAPHRRSLGETVLTERQLQDAIVQTARLLGWLTYHTYDSRRSDPGFPDLVLVRGPRLIFAELKTEKGRMTAEQEHWRDLLQAVTAVEAYLWRPADWFGGDIDRILKPAPPFHPSTHLR